MIDLAAVKPGAMLAVKVTRVVAGAVIISPPNNGMSCIPADFLHPLPTDPHAALRDAVVAAARAYFAGNGEIVTLRRAVNALNAVMAPPDPVGELLAAIKELVPGARFNDDTTRLCLAIAAVEAMRRA